MTKFIRKSLVVEATQWFKDGDHPAVKEQGFLLCLNTGTRKKVYKIKTLAGGITSSTVYEGDWIVTGVEGDISIVKPHIFDELYESVET